MQVTHQHDHVTHAVIGPMTSIAATINNSAEFMHMVTSTIYSDQPLACVREVLCNAWDAHIDSNREHIPLLVTLTRDELIIQDFGHGIPHSMIGEIYGTYGGSTKAKDNKATGGFGLGSKAPWAYQDTFEVTSCHRGTKTLYIMAKSSGEVMGKPGITPLMSMPTDESGLTVKIKLKPGDWNLFDGLVRRVISNGGMLAMVNGVQADVLPWVNMESNYLFTRADILTTGSEICVRIGTVIYPLNSHPDFAAEFTRTKDFLKSVNSGHVDRYGNTRGDSYFLIFQAPPGSASPTPSRESLSMQAHTVATMKKLLTNFNKYVQSQNLAQDKLNFVTAQVELVAEEKPYSLLSRDIVLPNQAELKLTLQEKTILNWSDLVETLTVNSYPSGQQRKDIQFRLRKLMENKVGDQGLIRSFNRMMAKLKNFEKIGKRKRTGVYNSHFPYSDWYRKTVLSRLARDMAPEKLLVDYKRLGIFDSRMSFTNTKFAKPIDLRAASPEHILPYLRKVILLYSNRTQVDNELSLFEQWAELGDREAFLCYQTAPFQKYQEAAAEFFEERGYTVLDLNAKQSWNTGAITHAPRVVKPKRDSVPRQKGFVPLSHLRHPGRGGIDYTRAFVLDVHGNHTAAQTRDAVRIMNPECYYEVSVTEARYGRTRLLNCYKHSDVEALLSLYGDKCAISYSESNRQKFSGSIEGGGMALPSLESYMIGHIINQVTQRPEFLEHWAYSPARAVSACPNPVPNGYADVFIKMLDVPEIRDRFGIKGYLSPEDTVIRDLWTGHVNQRYGSSTKTYKSIPVNEADDLIKAIPIDPAISSALEFFLKNPLLRLFNIEVLEEISTANTGSIIERHHSWLLKEMILTALKG